MKRSLLQFKPDETPQAGVQRLVALQRTQAEQIVAESRQPAKAVHQVRLRLKFLRALLRLARELTGKQFYQRENARLKKAADTLSGWRDVTVVRAILQNLGKELGPSFQPALQAVIESLSVPSRDRRRERALLQAIRTIRTTEQALAGCTFRKERLTGFTSAVQKSYRQARRSLKAAFKTRTDETFHESRKRVKRLFYHVSLFEPAWPEHLKKTRKQLRETQVILGRDHDLSVTREILASRINEPKQLREMNRVLQRRSRQLRKQAAQRSAGLFSLPPHAFAKKLERHIKE